MLKRRIIATVTNDLTYDQRMQRTCRSLVDAGYDVLLVGRLLPNSRPFQVEKYEQHRLNVWFKKGFLFYAAYNLRLFFFLLFARFDAVLTVDLDSLPAGASAAWLRRKRRVFDAHEYFTEVPEVVHRPFVKGFWAGVARLFLPIYNKCYTVGPALAAIFTKQYGLSFEVVRNMPLSATIDNPPQKTTPFVIGYQGALNEGRGIEALIDAMPLLPEHCVLWLMGEGDLSAELRQRAAALNLGDRIKFWGYVLPDDLKHLTSQLSLGCNLLENKGLSYYYSLANKFFDYVQAEVPVLTMAFPEYQSLNQQFEVALLLDTLSPEKVAAAVEQMANDAAFYRHLQAECSKARQVWHWAEEEKTLLRLWKQVW